MEPFVFSNPSVYFIKSSVTNDYSLADYVIRMTIQVPCEKAWEYIDYRNHIGK